MNLNELGWNPFFRQHFASYQREGLLPARVASENRGFYLLYSERGDLTGQVPGRFAHNTTARGDFPAVGDWVAMRPRADEGQATIVALLPRKSKFSRKVAGSVTEEQVIVANVDTAFLISGLDQNLDLRRIERYVTLAWESGANPVIVLNKADLCADVTARIADVQAVAYGVPVHAVSALDAHDLDVLRPYLGVGQTVALLGSSGVGKSTLTNALLGFERQHVYAVREDDSRGRHTTIARELIPLPGGGLLVDNPGMRELQLWGGAESLDEAFEDILALAAYCRFRDCAHRREPGCAVRQALEDGRLDPARFRNYLGLKRELKFLETRQDQRARMEEKAMHKRHNRWVKQRQKEDW